MVLLNSICVRPTSMLEKLGLQSWKDLQLHIDMPILVESNKLVHKIIHIGRYFFIIYFISTQVKYGHYLGLDAYAQQ